MREGYINQLPGVPAVESPFFDEIFDEADPYYEVAVSIRDNGFAVIDFPESDLDGMIQRIKASLFQRYNWEDWNSGGYADMRAMDMWRENEDVRKVAVNKKIQDLLGYLYGRKAFPFQTLNFPVGTQQHFHTDAVHFSSMPERFMCGVWLALEDIGPDQGPLYYYPGSHKWPIYTRQHIGKRYTLEGGRHQSVFEPLWERLVDAHNVKPIKFYPRKGQALIWAANLIHGGDYHNDRSLTRWSQVTHYYFEDCLYYTPLASNEPEGEYHWRKPVDIISTTERSNSYLGKSRNDLGVNKDIPPVAFDPEGYLRFNPDVAKAGFDPWEHFKMFGKSENRRWK